MIYQNILSDSTIDEEQRFKMATGGIYLGYHLAQAKHGT